MTNETSDAEYGKCVHCEKLMTKLEAEQSEQGNEDWDELTCDECAGYCVMSETSCEVCEVVDCQRMS